MTGQLYPDPPAGTRAGTAFASTTEPAARGLTTTTPPSSVSRPRRATTTSSAPSRGSHRPRLGALALAFLALARPSLQQHDPVADFCRRFGHQTAVVGDQLIVDGGYIDWNPITTYPQNYTSKLLLCSAPR